MTERGTPYAMVTAAGTFKVLIREDMLKEAKTMIEELKKSQKALSKYLRQLTEPEETLLAERLGMSEKTFFYTYVEVDDDE